MIADWWPLRRLYLAAKLARRILFLQFVVRIAIAYPSCEVRVQLTVTPEDGSSSLNLIILATNKNGYGNLSELRTVGRVRGEKGSYLIQPHDIAMPVGDLVHLRGLPDCQFILVPKYNADYEAVERQAAWLVQLARGRARIALTLHHRVQGEKHRGLVNGISDEFGLPVVATGDVCMHVRSNEPLKTQ